MTPQSVLTIVLDASFVAVFVLTLRDYLRRRERVGRAVVATFGTLALVLVSSLLRPVLPAVGPLLGLVSLPAFLAQPLLALWLVHHFRPIARPIFVAGVLAFLVLNGTLVAVALIGSSSSGGLVAGLLVGFLGYFLLFELAAAVGFVLEARRRAGASRARLAIAGVSTALFGAAIGILVVGGLAAAGSDAVVGVTNAVLLVLLLAAAGYLAAFTPPRWLRRLSHQSIAYDFIRDLNALPADVSVEPIWALLCRTAVRASGARRADIRFEDATAVPDRMEGDPAGDRLLAVPLGSQRWPGARLEIAIAGSPLFVEDDLELIGALAAQAARAAEREDLAADRERLIADLRAASAAKSDFLASMSHELRTPLNAIIGFSELLMEPGPTPLAASAIAEYAGHIHGSGLHLLELVNEVLDLAKVEAGRLELKPVAFDIAELVRQTVETMRPLADRKHLEIVVAAPDRMSLVADPARVRQVAFNLLSNAIKFTPVGGRVTVALEADAAEIRLRVTDTGPGIPAADRDRIFEAFEQSGRTPGQTEGTGLGLALTRRLVEAHGGRVELASEHGAGSEFVAHLPVRPVATGRAAPNEPTAGTPRVLVIEDDPAAAELLRLYLDAAGYGVVVTASGIEGVAWAKELRPEAIVLDILLPDTDGWEVLQDLKRNSVTEGIPVLVVSVLDDRPLGLALGAVDYFVKPVARDSLLAALGRLTFTTKVKTRTVTALVIDADPAATAQYRSLLEPEGFRVLSAADGADGCKQARASQPDLVLLDVMLPDVDGLEVVARLKGDPATSSIPIWVTTPAELDDSTKARLNGNVLGVAQRGDAAMAALRTWLNPTAASGAPS